MRRANEKKKNGRLWAEKVKMAAGPPGAHATANISAVHMPSLVASHGALWRAERAMSNRTKYWHDFNLFSFIFYYVRGATTERPQNVWQKTSTGIRSKLWWEQRCVSIEQLLMARRRRWWRTICVETRNQVPICMHFCTPNTNSWTSRVPRRSIIESTVYLDFFTCSSGFE